MAVTLLFCGCAHLGERAHLETPGAKLFLRDPNKDGRRQWHLLIVGPDQDAKPALIFDEERPDMAPPPGPVALTGKPFTPRAAEAGYYLGYHLLVLTDDPPAGRGVAYLFERRLREAHPILWWGLEPAPGFDDATPAANWAKLQELFKKS